MGAIMPLADTTENCNITLEPGALDDIPIMALVHFLSEHGCAIDDTLMIRRRREEDYFNERGR
jgi:hypothetical protein